MSKALLKICNFIFSLIVFFSLLLFGCYAAYALWDNNQILSVANGVQEEMLMLKPTLPEADASSEGQSYGFDDLLEINPDVVGWITMDNTNIDFPVLQGDTNLEYINRDVYGEYSLAGSIYLDSRNDSGFEDAYSLLYGHHMENSGMFGDIDLFKKASFFYKNTTGTLILPHRTYEIRVVACFLVDSAHELVFEPPYTKDHLEELLALMDSEVTLHYHSDMVASLRNSLSPKLLALSTCSSEYSDARTVLLVSLQ